MNCGRGLQVLLLCLVLPVAMPYAVAGPRSGNDFLKPETREMQDDDFLNPGMLSVERGLRLFNAIAVAGGKACTACHGPDGSELDAARIAGYPLARDGTVITLGAQLVACRTRSGAVQAATSDADTLALETFVRHRARGLPVSVADDAGTQALLARGKQRYATRYGLIDISCSHCHDLYTGHWLRGQQISEAQGNGFPAYRLDTGEITSLDQRIAQCMTLLRAQPFAPGAEENRLLELYIMSRSGGLPIETPAVRY